MICCCAIVAGAAPAVAHEVVPPRPTHQPNATWPAGHESAHDLVVPVVLIVARDGSVQSATVEVSLGEPFDTAAVRTAKTWQFEPARGADGPVRARVRAAVRFVGMPRAAEAPIVHAHPHGAPHVHEPGEVPPERREQPVVVVGHGDDDHAHPAVRVRGRARARSASEVTRDRRVLEAAPHRTASDLLLTVPGAFVTQHSGEGKAHQIFFRGFDALHGQDIEFWVAGAPVNEVSNVHGQGYADLHFLMPEVVRQVRAWPGPFDPRQGDFAVAGTMAFELGWDEPGATVSGSAGSFGTRRAFAAYRPARAPEETFAAAEVYETHGFGIGRAASRASAVAQWLGGLGAETTLRVMASTYAGRFGSAGVLRLDDIERGAVDRFGSYDTDQGGHSTRSQLVVDVQNEGDDWSLSLTPYAVLRSLELRNNYTGFIADPLHGDSVEQLNDATTIGARAALRRRLHWLSDHDAFEIGVFGRSDFVDQSQRRISAQTGRPTRTEVDSEIRAVNAGSYADLSLHPLSRLALRGGVRVDGLSYGTRDSDATGGATRSAQGSHIGKKLTTDLAIVPGLNALASYGEGFRSPQARSLADGERAPFTTVRSLELGARYRGSQGINASLAAFRTTLSDDVVFDETSARNEPVPATERLGAVADVVAEPAPWFTSALGATYTHARFRESGGRYREGELVPFVPQVVVRSDLAARADLGRVLARTLHAYGGLGLTALHRRPLPYSELGTDVVVADVKAGARLQEVQLELEIFNLLDLDYNDGEFVYPSSFQRGAASSLLPVRHVTAGPPRTLLFTLTLFV
jgi:iron complex outermembrane recepter protein